MTIGSFTASTTHGEANPDFASLDSTRGRLIELLRDDGSIRDELKQEIIGEGGLELSMGMSNDFVEAIEQGSSNVRVGSSIFGMRT